MSVEFRADPAPLRRWRFPVGVTRPGGGGSEGGVMYEDDQPRVTTRRYERRCSTCTKWFWAWDPERTRCYFCRPLSVVVLAGFYAGLAPRNGNGHSPIATLLARAAAPPGGWCGYAQGQRAIPECGMMIATPGANGANDGARRGESADW